MGPTIWVVAGTVLLVLEARRLGSAGLERFHALDPDRARAVVDGYRSRWGPRLLAVWAGTNLVSSAGAVLDGRGRAAAVAFAAFVLLLAAAALQRHNRPRILREAEQRELGPETAPAFVPREPSRRRARRQRQLGAVAVGALLLFPVVLTLAEVADSTALLVLGLAVLGAAALAVAGWGWATAWVYGDEQPLDRPA